MHGCLRMERRAFFATVLSVFMAHKPVMTHALATHDANLLAEITAIKDGFLMKGVGFHVRVVG